MNGTPAYASNYKYVKMHNNIYAQGIQVQDLSHEVPKDDDGANPGLVPLDIQQDFSISKECLGEGGQIGLKV